MGRGKLVERPPQTKRPHGHPTVRALEGDATGETYLEHLLDLLGPGEWHVRTEDGFWWLPHRVRHEINVRLVENPTRPTPALVCTSSFSLVEGVKSLKDALAMVNVMNQRSLGAAAYVDLQTEEIKMFSGVVLSPVTWFDAFVFENVMVRQVGYVELAATRLAEAVGGRVCGVKHPRLGLRTKPDQLVAEATISLDEPEAGTGLWWSRSEVAAFKSGLKFFVQQAGQEVAAGQIEPEVYDDEETSAWNLYSTVTVESGLGPLKLTVMESQHPEVGRGVEVLLSSVMTFEGERNRAEAANETVAALTAANLMNWTAAQSFNGAPSSLVAGGWIIWRGQLSQLTFIPAVVLRMLQTSAQGTSGQMLALVAWQQLLRSNEINGLLQNGRFVEQPQMLDEFLWDGLTKNAALWWTVFDADTEIADAIKGLPLNELLDPVDVTLKLWRVPCQMAPIRFGIFNPAGPSVGSIEVAVNYRLGRGLVLERIRHPFAPSLRLHAVLDREGFDALDDHLAAVVAALSWSTMDWCDLSADDISDIETLEEALYEFAERQGVDTKRCGLALAENLADPWSRVDFGYEPESELPDDTHPDDLWLSMIVDAVNIDTHLAYMRSAWEGAMAFQRSPDEAEAIMERCVAEIVRRGDVEVPDSF